MLKNCWAIVMVATGWLVLSWPPSPSYAQDLTADLQQAVCDRNWELAIQLVDRVIQSPAIAPLRRSELVTYRGRLQSLLDTKAVVGSSPNCGSAGSQSSSTVATGIPVANEIVDRAFLAEYKAMAQQYPEVSSVLLSQVNQTPAALVSNAQNICQALQAGRSANDALSVSASGVADQSQLRVQSVNAAIVRSLAPKHYCTAFNRRRPPRD